MADGSPTSQATKNSIIVVHGDVLDKIGFHIAEKANRSAELRLEKTLHTLHLMELKGETKHRKERLCVQESLDRLKDYQLRIRRQQLKKNQSSDDLEHDLQEHHVGVSTERENSTSGSEEDSEDGGSGGSGGCVGGGGVVHRCRCCCCCYSPKCAFLFSTTLYGCCGIVNIFL